MLIDDSPEDTDLAIRELKRSLLANKFYTFKKAEEALVFLRKKIADEGDVSKHLLILLDLNMPGMSGLEFLQAIRADESTRDIHVAILTASTQLPDIQESLRMGVHYVAKPIGLDDISAIAATMGFSLILVRRD